MDQNDGLEAKIFKEEIKTTLTMDSREIPSPLIRISLRDRASYMGAAIRTMEDHVINARLSHSKEAMKIDIEMNVQTMRMETGETMEDFLVP